MNIDLKTSRSEGVTDAERYLKKLCERSFLSMWSYVGVFNDKGTGKRFVIYWLFLTITLSFFPTKIVNFQISKI
jgi:hypothetical protein